MEICRLEMRRILCLLEKTDDTTRRRQDTLQGNCCTDKLQILNITRDREEEKERKGVGGEGGRRRRRRRKILLRRKNNKRKELDEKIKKIGVRIKEEQEEEEKGRY